MKRFLAVVVLLSFVGAACGADRVSEDATETDVVEETEAAGAEGAEEAADDATATPTTLAPVAPPTTGAPGDVALTATFGDTEIEVTHGELNEVVVPTQENAEFVELVFGGVQPQGFDAGVLTERLVSEAIRVELEELGASVSDADLEESRVLLLQQAEGLYVTEADPTAAAEALYDAVPYLPFLVDLQAGQNALANTLVASAEGGEEVPCVRHILVETEAEGDAIQVRLDDGEDFAELAIELSTGPSGPSGGDLGCASSANYVPPFAEAVDSAEIGEFVGPVQTDFGWHVILVEGTEAAAADGQALASVRLQEILTEATVEVDENLGTWDAAGLSIVPVGP